MGQNNHSIPGSSTEWLAFCGYIFPGNEKELAKFNELLGDIDGAITGKEVDPFAIIRRSAKIIKLSSLTKRLRGVAGPQQMVARRAVNLPQRIVEKCRKKK